MFIKNKKILLLLINIIHFVFSLNNESLVVFPFKSISLPSLNINYDNTNNKSLNNNYNILTFFNDEYLFRLFSTVKIGNPPQNIIAFVNSIYDKLLIGELWDLPNNIYPDDFYLGYQYNKSSSFINLTYENETINTDKSIFLGEESLYLYTNINNIKEKKFTCFSNFKFRFENKIINNNNSLYGVTIGLTLDEYNYETNFMKQIRLRNIINSYIISFEYTNDNEGMIIIGQYLHECFPEKYKKEHFKSFYSYQPRTMYLTNFVINFDEIYSYNKNEKYFLQKTTKSNIILNSGLIVGTNEYMQFIINYYFNKYIDTNTCEMNYTSDDFFDSFLIISCHDNENFTLEEFPPLNFEIKSQNITFEFTYKDLFKKINDKYYFLIIFERFKVGYWRFGKPFYSKYTFVYNGDAKTIGFYLNKSNNNNNGNANNNDNKKEEEKKDWKLELNAIKIVVIIILLLIFIVLVVIISYFIGKKCNTKRKMKANELDDNFEYVSPFPNN